ncbi:uncharacterized protein TRIVIDRAFT_49298 [Trichoderma virens Gv29-8]|uniref:Prion-inhibition and propagation HeLo domain-containing protein n=1 Tax=Hypocrea virens (strain Gv29-8 / FGSC 10586) TaxID=413071 RepID=G9N255_HYPVG|nr:uncharacterized protein TRIVIDRAFT_49298 [Trichoderma virens Gv29-8]EHK19171.1 hypothetical protein TRIVIDRAFT_49298 [Trichoderma virens Gv29-8]UKZ49376.1 hypothetical protein TrVGV298_003623 [Trichoderma virens]
MDAVGGTVSIFRFIHQCFSHIKQARGFEDEFGIYQLQLQMLLVRCAFISRIINDTNGSGNPVQDAIESSENRSEDQEPTTAEALSAIQEALRKAKRDAAKIKTDCTTCTTNTLPLQDPTTDDLKTIRLRMTAFLDKHKIQAAKSIEGVKWALYKREMRDRFITEISTLILQLERQINTESLAIEDAGLMRLHGAPVTLV